MGITASCGHKVEEIEDLYDITTKEWTIGEDGWQKAICYKSVCETCKKDCEENDEILYTHEEEMIWIHSA
jgi:hypothetical protein